MLGHSQNSRQQHRKRVEQMSARKGQSLEMSGNVFSAERTCEVAGIRTIFAGAFIILSPPTGSGYVLCRKLADIVKRRNTASTSTTALVDTGGVNIWTYLQFIFERFRSKSRWHNQYRKGVPFRIRVRVKYIIYLYSWSRSPSLVRRTGAS